MKQPTTLDEYIWKERGLIVEAARKQIVDFDLQKYYANEKVSYDIDKHEGYVKTIPLRNYLDAIDALCSLATSQLLTETEIQTVLKQQEIEVKTPAIQKALEYAEKHVVPCWFKENKPSEQESRNMALDSVLKERGILNIGDNYTIYVFLPGNDMLDLFCNQLRDKLPEGIRMDKQSRRAEGEGMAEGCEHNYYVIEYNQDKPASEQFKIPKGNGTVRQYDTILPPNQLLLRWHGAGRGCADFIKTIAAVVQEYRYEAHFNEAQAGNVLGGVFYKPKQSELQERLGGKENELCSA